MGKSYIEVKKDILRKLIILRLIQKRLAKRTKTKTEEKQAKTIEIFNFNADGHNHVRNFYPEKAQAPVQSRGQTASATYRGSVEEFQPNQNVSVRNSGQTANKRGQTASGTSRRRRWSIRPQNKMIRERQGEFSRLFGRPLPQLSPDIHFRFFRMDRHRFDSLVRIIGPSIVKKNTHSVSHPSVSSAQQRLAITIRALASGESFTSLAVAYRLGKATVSQIFVETCQGIWESLKNDFVPFPKSVEDWESIQQGFNSKWNFPNCLGAIDGKHIQMKAHSNNTVLFAIVDSDYCFIYVDIGSYGKIGDIGIFEQSDFQARLKDGTLNLPPPKNLPGSEVECPVVFLGDESFPLKTNLLKPFPRQANMLQTQETFNNRLSRARSVVDDTFGILTGRWQMFQSLMATKVETSKLAILAAVALHNYLMKTDSDTPDSQRCVHEEEVQQSLVGAFSASSTLGGNQPSENAQGIRTHFAEFFQSDAGWLPDDMMDSDS